MHQTQHDDLRNKIDAFVLDEPGVALPFSRRLAEENGWSKAFTVRAIREYRRFLFLSQVAGHRVTPSDAVDQVWHLHLTYSRSYWDGLCRGVLGRPLHHQPTLGGFSESDKFFTAYSQTLASYRRWFGEDPLRDVWPAPAERFSHTRQVRVDRTRHWLLSKRAVRSLATCAAAVACVFGVAGCHEFLLATAGNASDLATSIDGPTFLVVFGTFAVAAVIAAVVVRNQNRAPATIVGPAPLSSYEVACLAGGPPRVVAAALATLVQKGYLRMAERPWWSRLFDAIHVVAQRPLEPNADRVEQTVWQSCRSAARPVTEVAAETLSAAEHLEAKLRAAQLLVEPRALGMRRFVPALLLGAVLLLGAARIWLGLIHDRPVLVLVLACAAVGAALVSVGGVPYRTQAGDAELERLKNEAKVGLGDDAVGTLAARDMALACGLFGLAALQGGPLDDLRSALNGAGGDGSGGGCGSGCGDGGCGGCGGCGG